MTEKWKRKSLLIPSRDDLTELRRGDELGKEKMFFFTIMGKENSFAAWISYELKGHVELIVMSITGDTPDKR